MSQRDRVWTTYFLVVCIVGLVFGSAPSALAQGYIPFTNYLPPAQVDAEEYESGYNELCRDGGRIDTYACVRKVIRDMQRRYDAYHSTCDHRGLFSLAYLLTTQEYQEASLEEGFFEDPEFVNHQDVIFARFYTDAADAWARNDMAHVPPVWRLAFQAAAGRSTLTIGDLMLGMSAHINRDLPIVLATIGLVNPETGESRKRDHDAVNAFLARVELDAPIRASWDPTFVSTVPGLPLGLGSVDYMAVIQLWREAAWRWAERLVNARTPAEEADVIMQIEQYAYNESLVIMAATNTLLPSSSMRDNYCRRNN